MLWQVVQKEWGRDLISSWNKHGWWDAQKRLGDKVGRIIGAELGTVLVADSTSVNLFKVVAAALDLHPGKIIVSGTSFTPPYFLHSITERPFHCKLAFAKSTVLLHFSENSHYCMLLALSVGMEEQFEPPIDALCCCWWLQSRQTSPQTYTCWRG